MPARASVERREVAAIAVGVALEAARIGDFNERLEQRSCSRRVASHRTHLSLDVVDPLAGRRHVGAGGNCTRLAEEPFRGSLVPE